MSIQAINSLTPTSYKTIISKADKETSQTVGLLSQNQAAKAVSGATFLAQMPYNTPRFNEHYTYSGDDLGAYEYYTGPTPPEIEIRKYNLSKAIEMNINLEDYISAISGKISLAEICHSQGKERDAYMLECSIRDLYACLNDKDKAVAKNLIREYNKDMAKYIELVTNYYTNYYTPPQPVSPVLPAYPPDPAPHRPNTQRDADTEPPVHFLADMQAPHPPSAAGSRLLRK